MNFELFRNGRPTQIFWALYLVLLFPILFSILWGLLLPGGTVVIYTLLVTTCSTLFFVLIGTGMAVRVAIQETQIPKPLRLSNLALWILGWILLLPGPILLNVMNGSDAPAGERIGQMTATAFAGLLILILAGITTAVWGLISARRRQKGGEA